MSNTREKILNAALALFAKDGYEAVSVSMIAGELNITKGALYRHFKNKRDIFDCILAETEARDAQRARQFELPEGDVSVMREQYGAVSSDRLIDYCKEELAYWTEDSFASSFRKMLTLEQYRSEEMSRLYQQYFVSGPLGYLTDIFTESGFENPREAAIGLYAPMLLFYGIYDGKDGSGQKALSAENYFENQRKSLKEKFNDKKENFCGF